jgi:predicted Holliday junction resolvase-like endonuclease
MDFFLEIISIVFIICVIILVLKLKEFNNKINAKSSELLFLKDQINEEKSSSGLRECKLHETIEGLREVLSEEQQSVKIKLKSAKDLEEDLLEKIRQIEKSLDEETENRKKVTSQKKSSEVRLGHVAETLAPFLDQFDFDPENCSFLGKPIDYISFDEDVVTFIEVKMGKSQLNQKQRHIRDLIKNKQVAWKEIRIK